MSALLAIPVFSILTVTGLLHLYWGLGGLWPGSDERSLSRSVVGARGMNGMPPRWVTLAVSLGILLAGAWPLFWTGLIALSLPSWIVTAGMIVLTMVFLIRGIAGYVPAFRRIYCEQPFAGLDRRYFSPLIIFIGLSQALLLITHWSGS